MSYIRLISAFGLNPFTTRPYTTHLMGGESPGIGVVTGMERLMNATAQSQNIFGSKDQSAGRSILMPANDNIRIDALVAYDPQGFTTRQGLKISDQFIFFVRAKANRIEDFGPLSLKSWNLSVSAHDKGITSDFEGEYLFNESEVCAVIDQMVSRQPNGEEGDLLNNGNANLFYLEDCVVTVRWCADNEDWVVRAWEFNDGSWAAGRRAFSRN